MALLTPLAPVVAGVVVTGTAVSSSDTISGNQVGGYLVVTNGGGGSINVTIADPGHTPLGNTGTTSVTAVVYPPSTS